MGEVIDDFERHHDIVALRHNCLGGRGFILNVELCGSRMGLCCLDGLSCGVDAGDGRAEPGQRLADEAATAADVEHAQARKALRRFRVAGEVATDLVADISEPDRIYAV